MPTSTSRSRSPGSPARAAPRPTKPVGLVHLAVAQRDGPTRHARELFPGDRAAIRLASVDAALTLALEAAR